jgi:endonuclease-3
MATGVKRTEQLRARTLLVADTLAAAIGVPRRTPRSGDPLDVVIGTILSQNTNDRNSHRAWEMLRATFGSWEDVLSAPVRDIAGAIRIGGMAPSKSKRLHALLAELKRTQGTLSMKHLKRMDDDAILTELTAYDGVGLKTAACVCLFALGRDMFPVDTHVHRLCNRLALVRTPTPDKTFAAMRALVPAGRAYELHTNLIRFGRRVCRAQQPQCGACPLFATCTWNEKKKHASRSTAGDERHDFMLLDVV